MKGKTLLFIALVLIATSFFASDSPGRAEWAKSTPGMLVMLVSRVGGVTCFIFAILRIRREKQAG
jgi:hypothetical protein